MFIVMLLVQLAELVIIITNTSNDNDNNNDNHNNHDDLICNEDIKDMSNPSARQWMATTGKDVPEIGALLVRAELHCKPICYFVNLFVLGILLSRK
jgi:hypothetical protein